MTALAYLVATLLILIGLVFRRDGWRKVVLGTGMGAVGAMILMRAPVPTAVFGTGSEWFWSMAQFVVVAGTLLFIARQLHVQRQSNMLASLSNFDTRWESDRMREGRFKVCADETGVHRIKDEEGIILDFFEEMGLYLERRVLDEEMIWDLYSFRVEHYWPLLKPHVVKGRKDLEDGELYTNFQELHRRMARLSRKKGITPQTDSKQRLERFRESEVQVWKATDARGDLSERPCDVDTETDRA